MRSAGKLALVYLVLGALCAAAGCGSKGQPGPEANTASISARNADSTDTAGASRDAKTPQALSNPVIALRTTLGEIVVELDAQAAPMATGEFLYYARKRHYDGTIFHRVIKDHAIVGGQHLPDLTARPGRTPIMNEAGKCGLRNTRGTIALMRDPDVIDSASCQFYINAKDNPQLDHKGTSPLEFGYCPFGKVIRGLDVVQKIADVAVRDVAKDGRPFEQVPTEPVIIEQVTLVR